MEENKWGVGEEICSVASGYPEYCLGRILSQGKEWYRLLTEKGEYSARISGKFRYETISICEYPADPKGGCTANRSKGNFHRIWRSWPIPAYKKKKPVKGRPGYSFAWNILYTGNLGISDF